MIILTDLDHTLLKSDGTISRRTLDTIGACRKKGCLFAIATARYWIGAERYITLLAPDYEITTDGTLIHSGDECIYSCAFTADDTNKVISEIRAAKPSAEITTACGKTVYWNSEHIAESERLHKAVYRDYSEQFTQGANKIVSEFPDDSIPKAIAEKMGCRLQGYRGERWYAFLPAGAGKTAAITALAKHCGIDMADIVAFGDDMNDMEMLGMCGKGIAVANAINDILDIADEVTLSNDEDGVAVWLEKHVL